MVRFQGAQTRTEAWTTAPRPIRAPNRRRRNRRQPCRSLGVGRKSTSQTAPQIARTARFRQRCELGNGLVGVKSGVRIPAWERC